jgi:hypothetical protein
LLQNRAAIQEESGSEMKARFEACSLELQEVLIGTPRAAAGDRTIEDILFQLRSRQVAREQVTTFQEQEKAAVQERTLNEAKATAAAQIALTQSLIQVKVHENEGAAALARANAQATKLSVDAYGGPEYRLAEQNFSRFADALTKINQPLVPQFLMSGAQGQENNGGLIPTAMLSSMFGRMMPDALEKLKEEAPKTSRGNGQ